MPGKSSDISDADTTDSSSSVSGGMPLFLFDWDDTCFPTTYLANKGYKLTGCAPPPELQHQLKELGESIKHSLMRAMSYGTVYIVTNAEQGWVEMTVLRFIPSIASFILSIPILSARTFFEPLGVKEPAEWKCRAFEGLTKDVKHVISFGDSSHERDALFRLKDNREDLLVKSIKFNERPDVIMLYEEHELLRNSLDDIVNSKHTLDLSIQN
jgi:hypothetical protein